MNHYAMQSETESAVQGILEEDESLPRTEKVEMSHMENCNKDSQADKVRDEEEKKQNELFEFNLNEARLEREDLNLIFIKDEKKRVEEENRLREWKRQRKSEEEGGSESSSGVPIRKQIEDKEWVAYLRKSFKEEKDERKARELRFHPYHRLMEKEKKKEEIVESNDLKSEYSFEDMVLSESEDEDVTSCAPEHSTPSEINTVSLSTQTAVNMDTTSDAS